MRYKCKLIVKDRLHDGVFSSFKLTLKYKKEGKLFYNDLKIINSSCYLHGDYARETLIPQLKILTDMKGEDFMKFLKDKLIKKLGVNTYKDDIYKQLDESVNILKDISKKGFFINIK